MHRSTVGANASTAGASTPVQSASNSSSTDKLLQTLIDTVTQKSEQLKPKFKPQLIPVVDVKNLGTSCVSVP